MSKIKEYIDYISAVRKLSDCTLASYKTDLAFFEIYCERINILPENADAYTVQNYIADLSHEKKTQTSINRALSSIRGFYNYLTRYEYRKDNPSALISNLKTPITLPSVLSKKEMQEAASLPEKEARILGKRDRALILMLYSTGARISELLSLCITSFDSKYESARIIGKRNKERFIFITDEAKKALLDYLPQRLQLLKGKNNDALFLNQNGGALSSAGARYIIALYEKKKQYKKTSSPAYFSSYICNAIIR